MFSCIYVYTMFSMTFQDILGPTNVFLGFQILKLWARENKGRALTALPSRVRKRKSSKETKGTGKKPEKKSGQ